MSYVPRGGSGGNPGSGGQPWIYVLVAATGGMLLLCGGGLVFSLLIFRGRAANQLQPAQQGGLAQQGQFGPPPGYGQPPPGFGQPPPGFGQPPPGFGQPPPGFGQPPSYAPPPQPARRVTPNQRSTASKPVAQSRPAPQPTPAPSSGSSTIVATSAHGEAELIKQLQSHSTIRQYFGDVQKLQFVEQKMVGKSEIASFHIAGSKSNGTIGGEVKFRAPARFISVQGITDSGQRFKFDF